jgi:hypothetical protein
VSEHEAGYFDADPEGKKYCPDPDIFGCEKHQYAAENEQRNRENPFSARVRDHGLEKLFPNKTIFTIDFVGKKCQEAK